jgi:prepilin-type N-terminal cleavage/methylation domain-containing protein
MKTMKTARATRATDDVAGFTLIELMVASVLGVIVLLAVSYAYIGNRHNYIMNAELNRMQESGRVILETIATNLRRASFAGCRANAQAVDGISGWSDKLFKGLEVSAGAGAPYVEGLDGNSPVLMIYGATEYGAAAVTAETTPTVIPVREGPTLDAMAQQASQNTGGNYMLIGDCARAEVFKTATSGIDESDGEITSSVPLTGLYTTGAQVVLLGASADEGLEFSLRNKTDGGSAVTVQTPTGPENVRSLYMGDENPREIGEGVAAFRVCVRRGERSKGEDSYKIGTSATDEDFDAVTVAQVDVILYSLNPRLLPEDTEQSFHLCGDPDASPSVIISASENPTHLRRVHRLFSTTVSLSNKIRSNESIAADKVSPTATPAPPTGP